MEQTQPKIRVRLTGTDGNVFALLGRCTRALKQAGRREEAEALTARVMNCRDYNEALLAMLEACDVS